MQERITSLHDLIRIKFSEKYRSTYALPSGHSRVSTPSNCPTGNLLLAGLAISLMLDVGGNGSRP